MKESGSSFYCNHLFTHHVLKSMRVTSRIIRRCSLGGARMPACNSHATPRYQTQRNFVSAQAAINRPTPVNHATMGMNEDARPMAHENVELSTVSDGSTLSMIAASATFARLTDEKFWRDIGKAAMRVGPKSLKLNDLLTIASGARRCDCPEDAELGLYISDRLLDELPKLDGPAFILAVEMNRNRPFIPPSLAEQSRLLAHTIAENYIHRVKASRATPTMVASGLRAIVETTVPLLPSKQVQDHSEEMNVAAAEENSEVNEANGIETSEAEQNEPAGEAEVVEAIEVEQAEPETTDRSDTESLLEDVLMTACRILKEHPSAFQPRQLVNVLVGISTAPSHLIIERPALIRAISRQLVVFPESSATTNSNAAEVINHTDLLRPIESQVGKRPTLPNELRGNECTDIMWSLGASGIQDEALVFAASASLRKPHILNTLRPQQIVKIVGALHSFKYQLTVLLDLLCVQARKVLNDFTLPQFGRLMLGLGSLGVRNEILTTRAARRVRAASQEEWDGLSTNEALDVFLGFARMRVKDEDMYAKAGACLQKLFDLGHLKEAPYFTLVRLVYAHSQANVKNQMMLDGVSYLLSQRFDESTNAALNWYLHACSRLDYQFPPMMEKIKAKLEDAIPTMPVFDVLKLSRSFERLGVTWAPLEAHVGKILPNELRKGDRMLAPLRPKPMERRKKARARKDTW